MLEYCHFDDRLPRAPGRHASIPALVRAWDDLVALCRAASGLRLLLTPFDTFFTWNRWERPPLQPRQWRPLRRPRAAADLPGDARR